MENDRWITASPNMATCVEVMHDGEFVNVRDSKQDEDGPVLRFVAEEWKSFTDGVKRGEFDVETLT